GCLFDVRLHRPPERVDWTQGEDRPLAVPACTSEKCPPHSWRGGLEGPCGIRALPRWHTEAPENLQGFFVPRHHQGRFAVASHESLQRRIHCPCLSSVAHCKLVLGRGQSERADHHRRQCICKLRLEHRPFAGDHAVHSMDGVKEKTREELRKTKLID